MGGRGYLGPNGEADRATTGCGHGTTMWVPKGARYPGYVDEGANNEEIEALNDSEDPVLGDMEAPSADHEEEVEDIVGTTESGAGAEEGEDSDANERQIGLRRLLQWTCMLGSWASWTCARVRFSRLSPSISYFTCRVKLLVSSLVCSYHLCPDVADCPPSAQPFCWIYTPKAGLSPRKPWCAHLRPCLTVVSISVARAWSSQPMQHRRS